MKRHRRSKKKKKENTLAPFLKSVQTSKMCCFSAENTTYLTDIQSLLLFGQPSKIYPIVQKSAKTVQRA